MGFQLEPYYFSDPSFNYEPKNMNREDIERESWWEITAGLVFNKEQVARECNASVNQVEAIARWLVDRRASKDPIFANERKRIVAFRE